MAGYLKAALTLLIALAVADVVGVVFCMFVEVVPLRYGSGGLAYAIWFVLGVFTGLLAFNAAAGWMVGKKGLEWTDHPGAAAAGRKIVWTSAALLVALGLFFHWLYWSRGVAGEYFVPDSAPHTITFFLAVFGGVWIADHALAPDSNKSPAEGG